MLALLIHIYYADSWEKIFRQQLLSLESHHPLVMINLCMDMPAYQEVAVAIRNEFPKAYVIATPNIGKDIGGKLALIDLFLKTGQDAAYIAFLHDKVSPHAITGDRWRNKLFGIIQPENIAVVESTFQQQPDIGIIGAKDFVANEYDAKKGEHLTTNGEKLAELARKFNLQLESYVFIAGTMFWVRSSVIKNFFSKHAPLQCREMLEPGNVTDQYQGTYTHSWERMLCWLATDQGLKIKGI